jgi:hypothetical protein
VNRIGLALAVALLVLVRTAMAEEGEGQRIARACAADFERLCAGRVPVPSAADFQKGGHIYDCLEEHLGAGQLSKPCWDVMMGGR